MKKSVFILCYCFIVLFKTSIAQNYEKGKVLQKFSNVSYLHHFVTSPQEKFFGLCAGTEQTSILNRDFETVIQFNYQAYYGGGGVEFSPNGKSLAYYRRGKPDTLCLYDIETKQEKKIEVDFIEGMVFFHQNADLIIYGRKTVYFYSSKVKKIVKAKTFDYLIDQIVLSPDDKTAIISFFFRGAYGIYDANTMEEVEIKKNNISQFMNLTLLDSLIAFCESGKVHFLPIHENSLEKIISTPYQYITDIFLDKKGIYITGGNSEVLFFDFSTEKLNTINLDIDGKVHQVYKSKQEDLLLSIGEKLVLYKAKQ